MSYCQNCADLQKEIDRLTTLVAHETMSAHNDREVSAIRQTAAVAVQGYREKRERYGEVIELGFPGF